jgi:hypothetical protein
MNGTLAGKSSKKNFPSGGTPNHREKMQQLDRFENI